MSEQHFSFTYEEFDSDDALSPQDLSLLNTARQITKQAYAPYSEFLVGAAARLTDGNIVTGTNQENASFPVGICAERVLLSAIVSLHPGVSLDTIAISYDNKKGLSNHPIAPCGICRQSLVEFEQRFNKKIRIILAGKTGKIYIVTSASDLLPLMFNSTDLT